MAASDINFLAYSDALVLLGTAGVVVPLVRRYKVSPVLAYLGAGAILGPLGLGQFKDHLSILHWLTVTDAHNVAGIADLGVVFLLFLIGLELSFTRLMTMRRLVFGLGLSQVAICAAVITAIAALMVPTPAAAIIIGCCLSLSSTAIVIELLSEQHRLSTNFGRASFSVLLAQDLAVVPILLFISIAGAKTGSSVLLAGIIAVLQAAVAMAVIAGLGRMLLRPLFRLVAAANSSDLFVAATLFVIVGTGVAAAVAGLSMALGAFIAGLLLAETEYRKAIETTVEPFKGLLLGFFFFTVGMSIDVRVLAQAPFAILAGVVGLITLKAALTMGLARLFKLSLPGAIELGLLIGPAGEFAFVGLALAASLGLIAGEVKTFTVTLTAITMALIPLLAIAARHLTTWMREHRPPAPELLVQPPPIIVGPHAIVVGHGRVGQIVCEMLQHHGHAYVATDRDPGAVTDARKRGGEVYYGDATNPAYLKACGIMQAPALIVTIHDQAAIDEIVRVARELRPDLLIISRARDATHARHLYKIGVSDAVPETIEASLQLSEAALVGLGIPVGPVIASIHEKRDAFRRTLQDAAGKAGQSPSRAIRAPTAVEKAGS